MNYQNGGFDIYSDSDFCLAGYPRVDDIHKEYKGERHVCSGKIKKYLMILNLSILLI